MFLAFVLGSKRVTDLFLFFLPLSVAPCSVQGLLSCSRPVLVVVLSCGKKCNKSSDDDGDGGDDGDGNDDG